MPARYMAKRGRREKYLMLLMLLLVSFGYLSRYEVAPLLATVIACYIRKLEHARDFQAYPRRTMDEMTSYECWVCSLTLTPTPAAQA